MPKKLKTSESTRKAIEKYNQQFERLTVRLPKGTSDKVRMLTGESVNALVNRLIAAEIAKHENKTE